MPVLIMVGKYDGAVGVDQMRDLADHLAHARFDEFDQSAHFPYAEEPDKFEKDLADFLSSTLLKERQTTPLSLPLMQHLESGSRSTLVQRECRSVLRFL
jgi:hypothetical protein